MIDWMAIETALTSWIERADSCLALPHWRCMCEQFCALMSNRHLPSLRSLNPAEEYVTSVGFGNLRAPAVAPTEGRIRFSIRRALPQQLSHVVVRPSVDFTSAFYGTRKSPRRMQPPQIRQTSSR